MDTTPGSVREVRGPARPGKRLARGLEDVSHLFLSRVPAAVRASAPAPAIAKSRDDRVLSLVCKNVGALEDGLRVVDANLPLEIGGTLDLVALDRCNQIVIIDVELEASDHLLLRGICHLDWFVRNVPITRRMYPGYGIDFATEPRLFLLAPSFSPVMLCAVRRVAPLRIACIAYSTAPLPAGTRMMLSRV
jgi:hypothetical protein